MQQMVACNPVVSDTCEQKHVMAAFPTSYIKDVSCYDDKIDGIQLKLERSHTTLCESHRVGVVKHKMDHLSCFIPAMLALGAHAGAVTAEKAKRYMQVTSPPQGAAWCGASVSCHMLAHVIAQDNERRLTCSA